jgi:hypothetical protein
MNRTVVLAFALFAAAVNADNPATDLTALNAVGVVAWRLDDAIAEAGPSEERSYLVTTGAYADFKLSVEFWVAAETNSGVFVRCTDPAEITALSCFEVNIWDEHPNQDSRTGSIVRLAKPTAHVDTVGQWNTVEIEVVGELIVAVFNGVETARLRSGERSAEGHVALQFGGGELVKFRNLRISSAD